jgi:hypothetical protein
VGGVVFLVQRLVAHHRPARRLDDLDVEAVAGVSPSDAWLPTGLYVAGGVPAANPSKIQRTEPDKQVVLSRLAALCGEAGMAEPDRVAHTLGLVIDGAIVAALITRDPGVADAAGQACDAIMSTAA